MLSGSQIFSSETLEAGVETLREQGVKSEQSPDKAELEKQLQETN